MRHILYLILITPIWNMDMTLVQEYIISNEPLYEVSSLYADLLLSITLSLTLYS